MNSHRIDTVIFDMDGVIIDSEPIHKKLERALFDELNIPVSSEEHNTFVGRSSRNIFTYLKEKYHLTPSAEEMLELSVKYYSDYLKSTPHLPAIPGALDLVHAFDEAGCQLAVASSAVLKHIHFVIDHFDLKKVFSHLISGDELEHSKPHPEIFLKAAHLMNAPPTSCLVIEDAANGVQAAKAAGMYSIGYQNSEHQKLGKADLVLHSFEGLSISDLEKQLNVKIGIKSIMNGI